MKKMLVVAAVASVLALPACTTTETQNKTIGAVSGAVLGGVVGNQVGGRRSTVVGAALGGAFGYLIGSQVKVTEQPDGSVKLDIPGAVLFDTNSARVNPAFAQTLDQIAGTLNEHPNAMVNVVGHTDSTGAAEYNQRLSLDRATSVTNYLQGRGVAPGRLTPTGQGEVMPIADNSTADGRAQNRRVEMFVR
ncbi:OmpA family protein [Denitromonas ohlonensis]|jgi:outer membrane protein OmpA-like peptidoglycan-associated protein|uniref:OmpA family protein n=2 Tax=Denitromonas TaxID=139331 RepID=A0A557SPI2_9RHOO|nr:OmpA family protein [Denitromonas ohlonensis]TVO67238.1 OmpA family protein [Denitromonas ohlonensis]TVO79298.1 OmpA family protein [Denitromonas ohlonensis]TVT50976.1 MAG: OmpA family protein [Denitromonas halophila]TVT70663.1 MAG: OmpA family protein [Denitromonas halophila]